MKAVKVTPKSLVEQIKSMSTFHGSSTYDEREAKFGTLSKQGIPHTSGVYFLICDNEILKIGKAEGEQGYQKDGGLRLRMACYFSSAKSTINKKGSTEKLIHEVMTTTLKDKLVDFYYFETPAIIVEQYGMTLEAEVAKSLETKLEQKAINEGHPLYLSAKGSKKAEYLKQLNDFATYNKPRRSNMQTLKQFFF